MSGRALGVLALVSALGGCAGSSPHYACSVPEGVTCQPVSAVYAARTGAAPVLTSLAPPAATEAGPNDSDVPDGPHGPHGPDVSDDPVTLAPAPSPATVGDAPGALREEAPDAAAPETPVLTAPRVLRLWVAPWEDADGDLHGASHLFLRLDAGAWQVPR